MSPHILVLDANILIRAVLGNKVKKLITDNYQIVDFFSPDVCFTDAEKYLPLIFDKKGLKAEPVLNVLNKLKKIVKIADEEIYKEYMPQAKERMKNRDIEDWPIAATSLALECPIWTEDKDFFGSGFSTWTTDNIHLFFENI